MGVSHVYHNRDLLKDCHARGGGGHVPLVPPWFRRHLWMSHNYGTGTTLRLLSILQLFQLVRLALIPGLPDL